VKEMVLCYINWTGFVKVEKIKRLMISFYERFVVLWIFKLHLVNLDVVFAVLKYLINLKQKNVTFSHLSSRCRENNFCHSTGMMKKEAKEKRN
jgi:hypothetical protein